MNDFENDVDDILSQLKTREKNTPKEDEIELTRDNLEAFLLKSAGSLVRNALNAVSDAQIATSGASESEEIEAVAELTKAASSAIEALNKIYVTLEKSRAAKELKTMDIQARLQMNSEDNTTKLLLSREEVFKELFDDKGHKAVIEIDSSTD